MIFRKIKTNKLKKKISTKKVPKHVAIILDGNGRWAKNLGLQRTAGHEMGAKRLIKTVYLAKEIGVKVLTVYAFSTENWSRPKEEVDYLMTKPLEFFDDNLEKFKREEIQVVFLGDLAKLPEKTREKCFEIEKFTKNYNGFTLAVALNYGGRAEIINSVKRIYENSTNFLDNLNDDAISENLYTNDLPELDLLIRPGKEKRLSNFLMWQSAYTELYFSNVLWPDFSDYYFLLAIKEFQSRQRRFGGLKKEEKGVKNEN